MPKLHLAKAANTPSCMCPEYGTVCVNGCQNDTAEIRLTKPVLSVLNMGQCV